MKTAAIITAKGGNTSVENKNVIPVLGLPVVIYPIRAAKLAAQVDHVYVSTEDHLIKTIALKESVSIIDRPNELATPISQHKDVIKHAVDRVLCDNPDVEFIVVLLGNTVMVTPGLIDKCIQLMKTGDCDSVLTAWKAQDDHPFRALRVNELGYAESFMNKEVSSNRQSYPEVYFYDQGVWAFRKECAYAMNGPSPWKWLGQRCRVIERPWVTGRDIHSWIDVSASSWYLTAIQAHDFVDYREL